MFKDKKYTAIITGGSRGVGAAAAKKLASHGWNVLITCTSSIDEAENIANQSDALPGEIVAIQADGSDDVIPDHNPSTTRHVLNITQF